MTLDAADVPDLIGALADRFETYNIGHREARHITVEMLEAAFADQADFEESSLVTDPLSTEQRVYRNRLRHH